MRKIEILVKVLESLRGLGLFLEVEALYTSGRKVVSVKKQIWDFIKKLGVKTSKELGIGKAELALMAKHPYKLNNVGVLYGKEI